VLWFGRSSWDPDEGLDLHHIAFDALIKPCSGPSANDSASLILPPTGTAPCGGFRRYESLEELAASLDKPSGEDWVQSSQFSRFLVSLHIQSFDVYTNNRQTNST
jgi:hypothetical protein